MRTVLKNALLFDGTGDRVVENAVVIIGEDGTIEQAGSYKSVDFAGSEDAITLDLEGKCILPGLIDAHVHIGSHGLPDTYEENLVEEKLRAIRAAREMESTLLAGITTVRNCGSVNQLDFSVKNAIEQGFVNGPRVLTSGKIISITCAGTEYFEGLYREADGRDEFKKAAREQLKEGADLLKVMATGAIMNPGGVPGAEQPDREELEAVVEEGAKLGKRVAAHAHGARGIENAVRAGCATIEHGSLAGEETLEMMAENNVYLVTTLLAGHLMLEYGPERVPPFMIEKTRQTRSIRINAVKRAIEAGVKVAMGSDAGISPYNYHGRNAGEVAVYVREGLMSPAEAITSATKNAAEACGIESKLGTVTRGKRADIIVVDGNPLDNIELLNDESKIEMVFKDGRPVKSPGRA